MGTLRRTCAIMPRRGPLPELLWANLFASLVAQLWQRPRGLGDFKGVGQFEAKF